MNSANTKAFNELQRQILNYLADGQCHSGEYLGGLLGVSRTAIWKQIHQLAASGIPVECLAKQGYRLRTAFIPLDKEKILKRLPDTLREDICIYQFSEIDSTNRFLKDLPVQNNWHVCCAEKQSQGRGRFGRSWSSPFGENIYLSIRREVQDSLSRLSGLSLIVSIAAIHALQAAGIQNEIRIKWPNDLIWEEKKLGGILIEMVAESHSAASVIIGIGLNVNSDPKQTNLSENPWCSLLEICGQYFDRNDLIASLLKMLDERIEEFLHTGLSGFLKDWEELDYLKGKNITVQQFKGKIAGEACGIDQYGQLCLRDAQGQMHYLSSGDTSLQKL